MKFVTITAYFIVDYEYRPINEISDHSKAQIYVESGKVTLTATNNPNAEGVLSNNRADKGGAIYVENGTVELKAGAEDYRSRFLHLLQEQAGLLKVDGSIFSK